MRFENAMENVDWENGTWLEMAAPYRRQFHHIEWVLASSESDRKYVYGKKDGDKNNDFYTVSGQMVRRVGVDDGYSQLKKMSKEDDAIKPNSSDPKPDQIYAYIMGTGKYHDVTKRENMASGKSTYATGEHTEQEVSRYKGTVYHGTEDVFFFSVTYNAADLGGGNHHKSLEDAFSVTPNFNIAKAFTNDAGMVMEFAADLNVYYASKKESELDEIDFPKGVDAVAMPYAEYEEDEFAVILWSDNLNLKAVHLPVKGKYKRYTTSKDPSVMGEYREYIGEWLQDVFGKSMDDVIRKHGDVDHVHNNIEQGVITTGDLSIYPFGPNPSFSLEHRSGSGTGYRNYKSPDELLKQKKSRLEKQAI